MEENQWIAKEYQKTLEELGWTWNADKTTTEIRTVVASGEGHSFIVDTPEFLNGVKEYVEEFDVDKYIYCAVTDDWHGEIPPVSMLVDDAREVGRRLNTLYKALSDVTV